MSGNIPSSTNTHNEALTVGADTTRLTPEVVAYLTRVYNNPRGVGAFGGVRQLYEEIKKDGVYDLSIEDVREFLSSRDEYTLHKKAVRKYETHHIVIGGPNDTHQGDLIDMGRKSAKMNDGINFILTIIDCFTRMAFAQPLENKNGKQMVNALDNVYKDRDTPSIFISDSGTEFIGHMTQSWFRQHDVQFYIAGGIHKAQYVERFNETLKHHLSRYMTLNNTLRYIDVLDDFVDAYNNRYNTATGYKPIDINETNARSVFIHMYGSPYTWFGDIKKPKFKVGDHVRISRAKGIFEKGYEENYTREIYLIDKILYTQPREYKLISLTNQPIKGRFYEKELVKVTIKEDDLYQIEKVLKERMYKGIKQYFVKWKGWDKSHNQWVNAEDVEDI